MVGNDPLCCPGRATFLTGQRSSDHGVVENDARLFDPSVSLATALQAAGYRTGIFGKYFNLMNRLDNKRPPGWDRVFIGGGYFDQDWWDDGRPFRIGSRPQNYSVDVVRRKAAAWLNKVPADRPAFLYLSPYTVHHGDDENGRFSGSGIPVAAPRYRGDERCADLAPWSTPAHADADRSDLPAYLQVVPLDYADGWPLVPACEALLATDRMLAKVEERMIANGRDDVVYLLIGDNGMGWGRHGWPLKSIPHAAPMPFLVHWAAGLGTQPRTIDATVTSTDLAPTVCEIAGCALGPFPNGRPVSGMSLLDLLRGDVTVLGREVIPIERPRPDPWRTITTTPAWQGLWTTEESALGRWPFARYSTGEEELYDLTADPWLTVNVAGDPARAELLAELEPLWRSLHP